MLVSMLKSKIHRASVTGADLNYEGSLTLDPHLMDAVDILPNELVQVLNINNGARAETYVIPGKAGSGEIVMNGAIARLAQTDDLIIICAYALMDHKEARNFEPKIVLVDNKNRIIQSKGLKKGETH